MGKGYQVGDKKKYGKGKTKRKAGPGRGKKVTNRGNSLISTIVFTQIQVLVMIKS